MNPISLVIDTDTASDDAVALLMAAREPAATIRAVTVVAGNVPLEMAVRNAIVTLDVVDHAFVPVVAGAPKPMTRQAQLAAAGPLGRFCVEVNKALDAFVRSLGQMDGFDLPDPLAMAVALDRSIATTAIDARVVIPCDGEAIGATIIAPDGPPNATVVRTVDSDAFFARLLRDCAS